MRLVLSLILLVTGLSADAERPYFPKGSLSDITRSDEFRSAWYSRHLAAMGEPSLAALAENRSAHCYRFLWLRSFHRPIAVRVELRNDGTSELTVKVMSGSGGYDPGKLVESVTRPLSKEQTARFVSAIAKARYWELPATENLDEIGNDGAQWIFEGVRSGKYHVIDRWSPERGAIRELGLLLVRGLAGIKVPKDELY